MNEPLVELLFERLAADAVPTETAEVVLGALGGEADLAAVLAGLPAKLAPQSATTTEPQAHIYLSSVTVAGFRGVGPERTLALEPEPGLTLVVGRNGSGKSSFAEAVELALTGDSARWADKNSVWRTGWRNLHSPDPCAISVDLRVDGQAAPVRVRRSWAAGAELADAEVAVTTGEGRFANLAGLGLGRPLELYRPFLTTADLGKLLAGTPSELFDALDAILGLEALTDADKRLMTAAKPLDTKIKEVRAQRETLRASLAGIGDDRARRAEAVLASSRPDLDRLDAILAEPLEDSCDETAALCRRLADLALPDGDEVAKLAEELRAAAAAAQNHDGSHARASLRTAELLRLALEHHADRGDGPCPVCDTGTLDASWRATAVASLDELRVSTLAAQRTTARLNDHVRRVRTLIGDLAALAFTGAEEVGRNGRDPEGVPMAALREAVAALCDAPNAPAELASHLAGRYPHVARAADNVRAYATAWLQQRDGGWQQAAAEVRAWVPAAHRIREQERALTLLRDARAWLKVAGEKIRNARLAPFAAHSQRIWEELRQESNVQLGAMSLAGASTRVVFQVSVDGSDNGTALGVMSQGEMHALGLATFLPRSCADESPFRFIIIDDPVQSMDPSKVDGLARVLTELSEQRQVVVFTHDSRLPDAVRRLDIDARVLDVVRAEQSVVTLRPSLDPVQRS